jgi:hypothetical protein
MPVPIIAAGAAAIASRLAAKKLAQAAAKKAAQTVATRARANSAKAAVAVAPKKLKGQVKVAKLVSPKKTNTGAIKINTNPKPAVVKPKKINPPSYNQLKGMPNLVKVDSAKGNSIKKVAYRKMTSN